MSTDTIIVQHEASGTLTRFEARSRLPAKRRLYMTSTMVATLSNANLALHFFKLEGFVKAALTQWVLGERVYNDGRRPPGPSFLKRLESPPPEVWEIRVTNPNPQVRVFGRFAAPDTFIATNAHTRPMLGRKGSAAWKAACQNCVGEWNSLFPNHAPFSAATVHSYITGNCDDFSI